MRSGLWWHAIWPTRRCQASRRTAGSRPHTTPPFRRRTWRSPAPGYRVTAKTGHHKVTLDAITLAVGSAARPFADYFETCRRKRNVIDYTRSHVAIDTEADEILSKACEFYDLVETWIASKFPALRSDSHPRS